MSRVHGPRPRETDRVPVCYATMKRRWPTRKGALDSANKNTNGVPLRAYKCPTCRDWHLTKRVKVQSPTKNILDNG